MDLLGGRGRAGKQRWKDAHTCACMRRLDSERLKWPYHSQGAALKRTRRRGCRGELWNKWRGVERRCQVVVVRGSLSLLLGPAW